jgi:hypothetical protein
MKRRFCGVLLALGIGFVGITAHAMMRYGYSPVETIPRSVGTSLLQGQVECSSHFAVAYAACHNYVVKTKLEAYYDTGYGIYNLGSWENTGNDASASYASTSDYTLFYAVGYVGTTQTDYLEGATAYVVAPE